MEYSPDFHDDEEDEIGLIRLSRVTYQLPDDQPDAMGWRVADVEGVDFGKVSDLLADATTGQIVFAAITCEGTGRTSLVPVEGMHLDEMHTRLIIPMRQSDIKGGPDFDDDVVDVMPFVDYWVKLVAAES